MARIWSVDRVKHETCRARILVAFGEEIEVLTDERDERALVRGRVGQHVNLQLVQYFAKFLIAGQLRVRRGGRGGAGGERDGQNCSDGGAGKNFNSVVRGVGERYKKLWARRRVNGGKSGAAVLVEQRCEGLDGYI